MHVHELEANVRTSFVRVKNDITDLNLRSNQLSLAQSDLAKLLKDALAEIEQLKQELKRKSSEIIVKKEAPIIVTQKAAKKIFIGSTTGGKVHAQDCPFAKNISRKNRVIFSSRVAAFKKGYQPCQCLK